MTKRFITAWICYNCGKSLEQTNTSRRRREFIHHEPSPHCSGLVPVSKRAHNADIRAIRDFLICELIHQRHKASSSIEYEAVVYDQ